MQLTLKQLEATRHLSEPDVNFILYGGAIRGAKTFWLCIIMFKLAKLYPNSRWAIVRASTPKITKNLWPSINEIIDDKEFKNSIVNINRQDNIITFSNKSQVLLFAESFSTDPELTRFHGLEVNGFGIDELSEIQEVTFDKCFERAGSWLNVQPSIHGKLPRPLVLATCNPSRNWVKTRIYDQWKLKSKLFKPSWRYVPAKITDNPFVPRSYYKSLRENMSYGNYKRFVEGDWEYVEKTGLEWVNQFDYGQHCEKVQFIKNWDVDLSFDFNDLPYTTMLACQKIVVDDLIYARVFDEYCLVPPLNYAEACCERFIEDYPQQFGYVPLSVYGDASGKWGGNIYRGIFKTIEAYSHNNTDRVITRNPILTTARDMINRVLANKTHVRLSIDRDRCPNLIKDLDSLQTAAKGFDPERINGVETKGHTYSALSYWLSESFPELLAENMYPV